MAVSANESLARCRLAGGIASAVDEVPRSDELMVHPVLRSGWGDPESLGHWFRSRDAVRRGSKS